MHKLSGHIDTLTDVHICRDGQFAVTGNYRPQGKVMFSQVSVWTETPPPLEGDPTRWRETPSLVSGGRPPPGTDIAWWPLQRSVRNLLECILVSSVSLVVSQIPRS